MGVPRHEIRAGSGCPWVPSATFISHVECEMKVMDSHLPLAEGETIPILDAKLVDYFQSIRRFYKSFGSLSVELSIFLGSPLTLNQ